jgi:hypothetical protein
LNADDVETPDFVVGLGIAGQLHEQISDLPPRTQALLSPETAPDAACDRYSGRDAAK